MIGPRVGPLEAGLVGLVTGAFGVAAVTLAQLPVVLGHDEAVFALQLRAWFDHGPVSGIGAHRAPLISILAIPTYLATGGTEAGFRVVGVAFGVASVLGVWVLGRRVGGPIAGVAAAAVLASSPPILHAATLFETDLPAVATLVWALVGLHHDFEERVPRGEPPGPGLTLAAVLAAGALYLRYGSALPIALIGLTALALWWPLVREHAARVGAAGGLFLVLLLPHFVRSVVDFGVPWGRVLHTSEAAAAESVGVGLSGYLDALPADLAGWPVTVAIAAGLVAVVALTARSAVRGELDPTTRGLVLLAVPGIVHIVAMGLVAPPVTRFIFVGLVLLVTAGAVAVAHVVELALARTSPSLVGALCAIAFAGLAWTGLSAVDDLRNELESTDRWRQVLIESSDVLLAETGGQDCGLLNAYVPQITWYGWCETHEFHNADLVDHDQRFLLLIDRGKRQPEGDELDAFLSCVEEEPIARFRRRPGLTGEGDLYRFLDDPPASCPAP